MKLLIAADIFPPQAGGPATYCVTLANELAKRGGKVEIVSLNPESDVNCVSCIMYHVSWRNKLLKYLQYTYLFWKHGKDIDVIYAMGPVNAGLPALIVSKLRGKKLVVKVVGDYAWEQGVQSFGVKDSVDDFQKKNYRGKIGWLQKIEKKVVCGADLVITPSDYLKKMVIGWGASESKVKKIYNAVEFKDIEPIKHEGEKWIVSVGRLVPWKGFDTLIEIMPDLLKEFPNLKLKIVGDGPKMANLQSAICNLQLNNVIELLGELPKEKTLSYIKAADLFILNSGYEGLSHVILEALSFNVSTLASRIGGNPELLDEQNLFVFNNKEEIKNKILSILKNYTSVRVNFELLNKFKLGTMISNTESVLEETYKNQ